MRIIKACTLSVAALAPLACCKSKFIHPPERDLDAREDFQKNKRYEYDWGNFTKDNEDSVYWFEIRSGNNDGKGATVAQSQYFNVSAPKPDETEYITRILTPTATTSQGPNTTGSSSKEDTITSPVSSSQAGLSRGETAGIAVGATIGGLLILGGVGWMAWRRLARNKSDTAVSECLPHNYQQQQLYVSEQKAELPVDPSTHPSEYATSRPGLHEAP
ncbi:hypothetical protein F53441_3439 [Fusarium austroafricanum]|uniref:Mid2 domain-containing protein n=1 Tax=Fusarium austroafricanum TaxID=2364996 RepID=A0A8H4NWM7_9HYPO|nr:hypothetical protein F53441_3439 [Fusarium austroafricanum]